ncbi:MAG TPA: hypothetical protein PLF81_28575 [Candidatus Anammoximicrobium sp.]|nr:hypothetical protein [Candidatus Anammoximicrobium sp.]
MPKFYVESGSARCVIDATDAEDAALRAFQWSCDGRDSVLAPESLDETAAAEFVGWELGEEIRVSEQGFGRPDAQVFDTLDLVPVWQGYAFPWC